MTATTVNRIRLPLTNGPQTLADSVTGQNPPGFTANTDIQLELGFLFNGLLLDASDFTQVTAAIKPLSNPDATALLAGSVVPGSTGWNAQPVQLAGNQVIPAGATFSAGGSYTAGVQAGASYTWTRGLDDLTLVNNSVAVTGSNLVPTGHNYATGSYSIAGLLTSGGFYQWLAGSANDVGVNGAVPATGFFIATGADTLNGSGSTGVTAEVYPATLGSNLVPGLSYSGTATPTGSNLIIGSPSYSGGNYTLTGLTIGATYYWTQGANDLTVPGLFYSGLFIATGTSITLTGIGSQPVTAAVQATTMPFTLTGLATGSVYYWTKGANDIACGSLTSSGFFTAAASSIVLAGISNAAITAQVQLVSSQTNGTFTASTDTVTITGTPNAAVTAGLVGSVGWSSLNDQHCIIPFSHTQTNLAAASGAYTDYALQVSVTTATTDPFVAYGIIRVYDCGYASGTPITGNIVPTGASYNGSGNYTLSGLIAGVTYYWNQSMDDLTAPGLTASGSFLASASSVTLTGTPSAAVTATVYSVPQKPFTIISALSVGATSFNAIAVLPYSLTFADAKIMGPTGGGFIDAQADQTTLGNVVTTGVVVNFDTGIPATGYYIKVVLQ